MNYGTGNLRRSKPVYCVTTGEFFNSITDAAKAYGIKNNEDIGRACKGKRESCGKDPITGVPLKWEYVYFDEEFESVINYQRSQIAYWQQLAAANKDELDYYRDLVKALVNDEMDIETLKELEGDEE